MDKQQYLAELERQLRDMHVAGIDDILAEYSTHFDWKREDGYSEQEIAARLDCPAETAAQYAAFDTQNNRGKKAHFLIWAGIIALDVIAAIILFLMLAWALVMGMFVVLIAVLGGCLILGQNPAGFIPILPYFSACLLGIACLSLALLVTIVAVYFYAYGLQLGKSYFIWQRRVLLGFPPHPPVQKYPVLPVRQRRKLRHATLVAIAVFGITLLSSFISMVIAAGFHAPWHAWEWFP